MIICFIILMHDSMIYLLSLWCFAELTDQILPSLVCKKTPGSVHVQQAAPQRDGGEQGGLQELRREKADRHLVDGQRLGGPQRHGPPLLPLRLPEPLRHRPEGGHPRRRLRPLLCCPFHGARPGLRLRGTRRPRWWRRLVRPRSRRPVAARQRRRWPLRLHGHRRVRALRRRRWPEVDLVGGCAYVCPEMVSVRMARALCTVSFCVWSRVHFLFCPLLSCRN